MILAPSEGKVPAPGDIEKICIFQHDRGRC